HAPLTFTLSGISKMCGLPQMKVAWIVVSGSEKEKREAIDRLEVIADTYLSANAPLQLALPSLLATRKEFRAQLLGRLSANLSGPDLLRVGTAADWTRLIVEGGWTGIVQTAKNAMEGDVTASLLRDGTLAHPGDFYGLDRGSVVLSLLVSRAEIQLGG